MTRAQLDPARPMTLAILAGLALALLAILAVPSLVTATLSARQPGPEELAAEYERRLETAAREVADNVVRWGDPAWQDAARAKLGALGIDVVLLDAAGREIYRSAPDLPRVGAELLGPDPVQVVAAVEQSPSRNIQRLVIPDPRAPAGGGPVGPRPALGIAHLFIPWPQPAPYWAWLVPLAGPATLLLTLVAVAWFIGHAVLRPLAAMSRAAQQIAAGDLEVQVPASRVLEVAEVATAFGAMGAALRRSLAQQAALEQERRFFISAIAHDLRTPLFALRGYLQGLEQGVAATPEKVVHYVRACQERATALERLIADLFAYARVEYLEEAPRREPLDLGELLRRSVEGLRPLAADKGIALDLDVAPEPSPLRGDAHLLARAAENLLDNALRHTPPGGRIRVGWGREGDRLVFSVSDNGPGIAPADLPHLFAPLYRGEASRNRQTGGAG
ncbi:MAG: hypothetical protein AVDCRST_MAG88-2517, partial [uncultured Thermomicrobiales bacterium]